MLRKRKFETFNFVQAHAVIKDILENDLGGLTRNPGRKRNCGLRGGESRRAQASEPNHAQVPPLRGPRGAPAANAPPTRLPRSGRVYPGPERQGRAKGGARGGGARGAGRGEEPHFADFERGAEEGAEGAADYNSAQRDNPGQLEHFEREGVSGAQALPGSGGGARGQEGRPAQRRRLHGRGREEARVRHFRAFLGRVRLQLRSLGQPQLRAPAQANRRRRRHFHKGSG